MQQAPLDSGWTLAEVLRYQAERQPHATAFVFLAEGNVEAARLTYAEIYLRARAIAAALQQQGAKGERVLLLFSPGLEFITAFLGCILSKSIAVPLPAPDAARLKRTLPRLATVADDTGAAFVLTNQTVMSVRDEICAQLPALASTVWFDVASLPSSGADDWKLPSISLEDLAYLQYSSGSTSTPKGVMISHGNLAHNIPSLFQVGAYEASSVTVTWMPHFHDYGLVQGLLVPLCRGNACYVMSPLAFLKRPVRWLQAISRYRATHSQSATFGYDYCARKIRPEQCADLDLSSWIAAGLGAEPIHVDTMRRFAAAFGPFGFRWEAFRPAYGLAEATLLVSSDSPSDSPKALIVDSAAFEQGRVVEVPAGTPGARVLSGSGMLYGEEIPVRIVDPQTLQECPPGQVGEIWCGGSSIALGYWRRPEETERMFRARMASDDAQTWLRTGDLGFINAGQLYVAGRLKDLIVIAGANHYPQDIEWTVEACHPDLRPHSSAAFSVEVENQERLVVVAEVKTQDEEFGRIQDCMRRAIAEYHELDVYSVALLRSGSLPKTSSGKIQRSACRAGFLNGTLDIVSELRVPVGPVRPDNLPGTESIQQWLRSRFAALAGMNPDHLDIRRPLAEYGMSSRQAIGMVADLEDWLGVELSPTLLYQFPTVEVLAAWLSEKSAGKPLSITGSGNSDSEPIAIVGLACRFPGASNPEAFWKLLREGVDAITEVPRERWNIDELFSPQAATPGKMSTRWGSFIEGVDQFDPQFFGISPREAVHMDPQQRILLEVAWEALESAGLAAERLAGSQTGVFVGICVSDYAWLQCADPSAIDTYTETGSVLSIAANRLSYAFDFRGPSMAVDTACSSSLTAVHLACESLRRGQSKLALAGGVSLVLTPEWTIASSQARLMADDGRCKAFDAGANGYVRGEGCGLVVLKRLSDAIRDGDSIQAVIRGTAVNQDGRSNGLTAPNPVSQQQLLQLALNDAAVTPHAIGYVEAHGTGTSLGDPIEFQSLSAVLGQGRGPEEACMIGSVKTNIGHLEAAAGIAGLIKVVLSLTHEEIPPHLHLKEINPYIKVEGSGLRIATNCTSWPRGAKPRLAGVSSFGIGGANAHAILEEAPANQVEPVELDRPLHVLALSARSEPALDELVSLYEARLGAGDALADIAFTASTGRSHLEHRVAVVAATAQQARRQLSDFLSDQTVDGVHRGQRRTGGRPKIAFLFGGQGAQYDGMGRTLYETQSVFRSAIDACAAGLKKHLDVPLIDILYPRDGQSGIMQQTVYTQPALFALQYALLQLWNSWGVEPDAVMGHSMGEYTAACAAGVVSLEDALTLVAARGRLMQTLPAGGAMGAVWTDEPTLRAALAPYSSDVSIAAFNGPGNILISGKIGAVNRVLDEMTQRGVRAEKLAVALSSHSPLVEPILPELERVASTIAFKDPDKLLVLNASGRPARSGDVTPAYWSRQMREAVQFESGIKTLADEGCEIFVDIGPGPVLLGIGRTCYPSEKGVWLPSLKKGRDDWEQMLESVAELWVHGIAVDWSGFDRPYPRRKVALPSYPFQHQRYWIDAPRAQRAQRGSAVAARRSPHEHPLLGRRLRSPALRDVVFESELNPSVLPMLQDHRVYDRVILPAAACIEMALSGAHKSFSSAFPLSLEDLKITEALLFAEDADPTTVQTIFATDGQAPASQEDSGHAETTSFQMLSLKDDAWQLHASGKLRHAATVPAAETFSLGDLQSRCRERISGEELYNALKRQGLMYGPQFRGVRELWRRKGESLGRIEAARLNSTRSAYILDPALLDSCLHLILAAHEYDGIDEAYVPVHLETLNVYQRMPAQLWARAVVRPSGARTSGVLTSDIYLFDENSRTIAELKNLTCRRVGREKLFGAAGQDFRDWLYRLEWQTRESEYLEAQIEDGQWIVFSDRGGVGDELCGILEMQAQQYRRLYADEAASDSIPRLLEGIASPGQLPVRGIIHLWTLDGSEEQERICGSVLECLKALSHAALSTHPRLCLVTRGTQPVDADSSITTPAGATLWGLANVLTAEHPELRTVVVDLDLANAPGEGRFILEELLTDDRETRVAVRKGLRYVQRLIRIRTRNTPAAEFSLRSDATYLITGGLGYIGLKLAAWMADRGARHLVLAGRSAGSDAAQTAVAELRGRGVEVIVRRLDVARQEQVSALVGHIRESMPALRGVVHAAGVLKDGLLLQQSWDAFTAIMDPKVKGAWNLHLATQSEGLDFFVLFSSAASLLPHPGQGNYAAGSAFLDSLAHLRRAQQLPAVVLNWGLWQGTGLGSDMEGQSRERLNAQGIGMIDPAQGLRAFEFFLQSAYAQAVVLPMDWARYLQGGAEVPLFSKLAGELRSRSKNEQLLSRRLELVRRLEEANSLDRQEILENFLAQQVMELLRFKSTQQLDPSVGFFAIGMDSMMAVELQHRIQTGLGVSIPATAPFDQPNITALARYLLQDILVLEKPQPEKADDDAAGLTEEQILAFLADEHPAQARAAAKEKL